MISHNLRLECPSYLVSFQSSVSLNLFIYLFIFIVDIYSHNEVGPVSHEALSRDGHR